MRKLIISFIAIILVFTGTMNSFAAEKPVGKEPLIVKKCADFQVTGDGASPEWNKAEWLPLLKLDQGGAEDKTRFKIVYSTKGIYVLFQGDDQKITTTFDKDFENLFMADVFEVFFHPDPTIPIYLEYEINHLNKELVLIIPNLKGKINGWIPWHYEKERCVVKKVHIEGGKAEMGAAIKSWSAELFFPYGLFSPLSNVPPVSGTIWKANFYRLDYDSGKMIKFAWTPIKTGFHEYEKYGTIKFE